MGRENETTTTSKNVIHSIQPQGQPGGLRGASARDGQGASSVNRAMCRGSKRAVPLPRSRAQIRTHLPSLPPSLPLPPTLPPPSSSSRVKPRVHFGSLRRWRRRGLCLRRRSGGFLRCAGLKPGFPGASVPWAIQ